MKFYFDVAETFIRTIAIEADNLEQAHCRAASAWRRGEFEISHEHPDEIEFINATDEVVKFFQTGDCSEEEIKTFDCTSVVYDTETNSYVCPVCGKYAADKEQIKDLELSLPKHCRECGTKLHY